MAPAPRSTPASGLLLAGMLLAACGSSSGSSSPASAPAQLLAHWSMDEMQGDAVADQSGWGFDARLEGASWAPGKVGGALAFSGASEVVAVEGGLPDRIATQESGSISLWFRFGSVPGPDRIQPLLHLGDGQGGPGHSGLEVEVGHFESGARLFFTLYDDDGHSPLCFDSGFDLDPGRWYQFTAVVGPDGNTGYLDGVELVGRHYNFGSAASTEFLAAIADPQVAWLGRGFLSKDPTVQQLEGSIDEVRIHAGVLSAAEVAAYFAATDLESLAIPLEAPTAGLPSLDIEHRPREPFTVGQPLRLWLTDAEPHSPAQPVAARDGLQIPVGQPWTTDAQGQVAIDLLLPEELAGEPLDLRVVTTSGTAQDPTRQP